MACLPRHFPCLIMNHLMETLQPQMPGGTWFGLFPVRSPLLWESLLISFPSGTEMFHFPELALDTLCIQVPATEHDLRRVSPFRNHRIKARLAAPRCVSPPTASFIASQRQGIHRLPLITWLLPKSHPLFNCQRTLLRTQSRSTCGGGERVRTDGLLRARQALSQLSYTPGKRGGPGRT